MDIREFYPLEQHDFVEFSRQETESNFAAAAIAVVAQTGSKDTKRLIDVLGMHMFPGTVEDPDEKAEAISMQLRDVMRKTYNMSVVGGKGMLEIKEEDDD